MGAGSSPVYFITSGAGREDTVAGHGVSLKHTARHAKTRFHYQSSLASEMAAQLVTADMLLVLKCSCTTIMFAVCCSQSSDWPV